MARIGRVGIVFAVLVLLILAVVGAIAFINSPQQVAQKWANALARRDEATLKKLVVAKDQERVSGFIGFTKFLPDMSAQLAGIEDRQGQKVAKVNINFSQVALGNFNMKLSGSAQLPFVLVRERLILWRVDLEKSEPLIREEARKAVLEAIKKNPALQSLLQFLPQR
jgi:Na+-transporting methylmalonyl-CoA/oxaloacetate decarboxylase gamma subunit